LAPCVEASGHDTTYPFNALIGEPLLDVSQFMDENYATDGMKGEELRGLQASARSDDSAGLEVDAAGNLLLNKGRKPKLPKYVEVQSLKTAEGLIAALNNLGFHYRETGDAARADAMVNHCASMRDLWYSRRFTNKDKPFIKFEESLRRYRSMNATPSNGVMGIQGSQEDRILTRAIHEMETELTMNRNSTRPGQDLSAAETKANRRKAGLCDKYQTGDCHEGGKCKYEHRKKPGASTTVARDVPGAFVTAHSAKLPQICLHFAYFGKCGKSTGVSCIGKKGAVRLHTCAHCAFTKGPHAISDGTGPNGQCP
jgi:hypothetical protein